MTHEPDPGPGYSRHLVYLDDLGVVGARHRALGALWLPWERRGDLLRVLREVAAATARPRDLEGALDSAAAEPFCLALIDELFSRRWLSFRCMLTPRVADPAVSASLGAAAVLRRAHQLGAAPDLKVRLAPEQAEHRPAVDEAPPPSGRARAEGLHASLVEAGLAPEPGLGVRVARRPADGLHLARFLATLVLDDWEGSARGARRRRISRQAAENLGWSDLAADTDPAEWKFNIAWVEDPAAALAAAKPRRAVQLRLPMFD